MSTTAPKITELQAKAKTILDAVTFTTARAVAVAIVADDGTKKKEIETAVRVKGCCIVVNPVLGGRTRDQSGTEWILDCDLVIEVVVNPKRNLDSSAEVCGVTALTIVTEVIRGMRGATRHPGGEFFRLAEEGFVLSQFDDGQLVYHVFFLKEAQL